MYLTKYKGSNMVERAAYKAASKTDLPQRVNRVDKAARADKPVSTAGKTVREDKAMSEADFQDAIRQYVTKTRDPERVERQRRQNENLRRNIGNDIPDVKLRSRKPVLAGNDR